MRFYKYVAKIKPTSDQLMFGAVSAWVNYSENKNKRAFTRTSKYIIWKCISCQKKIKIHYKNKNLRFLYCDSCRPNIVRKNAVLFRYQIMFKNHVNAKIIKHIK